MHRIQPEVIKNFKRKTILITTGYLVKSNYMKTFKLFRNNVHCYPFKSYREFLKAHYYVIAVKTLYVCVYLVTIILQYRREISETLFSPNYKPNRQTILNIIFQRLMKFVVVCFMFQSMKKLIKQRRHPVVLLTDYCGLELLFR